MSFSFDKIIFSYNFKLNIFFLQNQNNIYLFKLIEYENKMMILGQKMT